MASLQRLKLLATECATAASSPSRSPTLAANVAGAATVRKSPSFHLPQWKTLRKLLTRSSFNSNKSMCRHDSSGTNQMVDSNDRKMLLSHTSLKDLFLSSPHPLEDVAGGGGGVTATDGDVGRHGLARRFGLEGFGGMFGGRLGFGGAGRFRSAGSLRYRLLRRAWRPVLVAIPE